MKISGDYPVYGGGNISYYINQYNREDDIIIAKDGISANCIRYEKNKFFLNHHGWTLIFKDDTIIKKYMFYYLQSIQPELLSIAKGMAQLGINQENFYNIKIPIPSIEKQEELVKRIDIFENANKDINNLIDNLKEFNKIKLESSLNKDIEIKTLDKIFILNGNGSTNSKDITNTGEYPFYRASCNNPSGTHYNYDFDGKEYLLIIKSGGCANKPISSDYGIGKVFMVNGKCAANIAVFQLLLKNEELYNIKYLYYYLINIQSKIQELAVYCTNNGNIDMKELMNLKIPIPSIEVQEEIIEYCDNNIKIIENLNKTIEGNKKIIKDIMNSI